MMFGNRYTSCIFFNISYEMSVNEGSVKTYAVCLSKTHRHNFLLLLFSLQIILVLKFLKKMFIHCISKLFFKKSVLVNKTVITYNNNKRNLRKIAANNFSSNYFYYGCDKINVVICFC